MIFGLPEAEEMFTNDWYLMPVVAFVEHYGLEQFDTIPTITQRHTAKFATRSFPLRYPEQTLTTLRAWAHGPSFYVCRLVSEGTQPHLPWAVRLPAFLADPTPVLELLEALRNDPSA